jgi:nicotinamide phosphoribosyltransferase
MGASVGVLGGKPADASDITSLQQAKAEITKLRSVISSGLNNLLLLTDSYKVTHWAQYPPGTKVIYSYLESRGGKHLKVLNFGLQYFLKRYLCGVVVTEPKIDEAERIYAAHFGPGSVFPRDKWMHIVLKHGGRLPIRICAPLEGEVIPYKNVLMTVENTDPECFWLTNFLETLLVQVCELLAAAAQCLLHYY